MDQREEISLGLAGSPSATWTELAARAGAHRTTVAREVGRNGGRENYRAADAQRRAEAERCRPRPSRLVADAELRARVTAELALYRSPAAIAADLAAEGAARVCHESIFRSVYAGELDVKARDCLRRRRARRRGRQARHASKRPGLPNIAMRPAAVGERAEGGHWEGDLIIGAHNRSAVLSMIERVSRYALLVDLPEGYGAEALAAALVEAFELVPAGLRRSLTLDQGSEWAAWPSVAATYGLDVWFCDPHSPWQRGAIENLNGHVRFWLPRGRRLDVVGPDELASVAGLINNQRRRILGWESPATRYEALAG
jgi:IS30 family transposase